MNNRDNKLLSEVCEFARTQLGYDEIIIIGFTAKQPENDLQVITIPEKPDTGIMKNLLLAVKKVLSKETKFGGYHSIKNKR